MELSYRQLEVTLAAYLNVHPDKMGTFRSRMKQLQRLEFPRGVNIGRGVRMTYTADHLLQLAVAFEIIGNGLAAKAATDLVAANWGKFQAAFGRSSKRFAYGSEYETFVLIAGTAPVSSNEEQEQKVTIHDLVSLSREVLARPNADWPGRAGILVVRADFLFQRLNRLASDVGQARNARWSPEYEVWSRERDGNQQQWDRADGGPPSSYGDM